MNTRMPVMPAAPNETSVLDKLRLLRETPLSDAWVASVIASTSEIPPIEGIPEALWATYVYVVAYRYGHLKGDRDPRKSVEMAEALSVTVATLEDKYPGLLDAPSTVAFAGPAFDDSTAEPDEPPLPGDEDESVGDDETVGYADAAWYGVSRLAAGTILLMGREGEAMPALQVRLYNVLDEEIFNRMLPFGDTLFIVSALLENLDNAFDLHQKSLKVGTLSPRIRANMETMVETAELQLKSLRATLQSAS